jgi:alkylated DNA repair dioxygenase AlkB
MSAEVAAGAAGRLPPYQASLFDAPTDEPRLHPLAGSLERTRLTDGAWIDVRVGWLARSDRLFDQLRQTVPWREERRRMYERVVDVPRLVCFYGEGDALPAAILTAARQALTEHYRDEFGEPFVTAGLCYYRNGHDSVAWHGDRIGRGRTQDTLGAILSLGQARRLALRPRGGGRSLTLPLGHGDLVVMGGSCQRTWEHAVPKTSAAIGPRISVQFRPRGVR